MDPQISCVPDRRFRSDQIFNQINKEFITLRDDDMKIYSDHLQKVVEAFKYQMKRADPLFNAFFNRIAYVGSYYENLKVGKPEEFDLNFVIKLPVNCESSFTHIVVHERSGYVKIEVDPKALDILKNHLMWNDSKRLKKWFNSENYLDQNAFREWFESVVHKALLSSDPLGLRSNEYNFIVDRVLYKLSMRKSGPAFTLRIKIPGPCIDIDVDLVPVLEFETPLPKPFRRIIVEKKEWFAVSKPLKDSENEKLLWRPSFYFQERDLIKGPIKEVIRQMKKFRNTQRFYSIASYYIKTLFLWELEEQNSKSPNENTWEGSFQKMSSTYLFFYMLQKLRDACDKGELNDYWNPENNLFSHIGSLEIRNFHGRIKKIIEIIDKQIASNEFIIAYFILEKDEFERLKNPADTNEPVDSGLKSIQARAHGYEFVEHTPIKGVISIKEEEEEEEEEEEYYEFEETSTSSLKIAPAASNDSSMWPTIAITGGILATAGILAYRYLNNPNQRRNQ